MQESSRWSIRVGSALAAFAILAALITTTVAIADPGGDGGAGVQQLDATTTTAVTTQATEPPTTPPTEAPTTPPTEAPTTPPTEAPTTPPTDPTTTQPSTTTPTTKPSSTTTTTVQQSAKPLVAAQTAGASTTFTVSKNFSDDSTATVSIALTCSSWAVATTPLGTSEFTGSGPGPAVFTLTGGTDTNKTCTATEKPVPDGYTGSNGGSCTAKIRDQGCTITNTLNTGSIEVTKKVTEHSSTAQTFHFVLSGPKGGGAADLRDGQSRKWDGLAAGGTYTLTEQTVSGWQVKSVQCSPSSGVDEGATSATIALGDVPGDHAHPYVKCTFTNDQTATSSFTVSKHFVPADSSKSVNVHLVCTSGDERGDEHWHDSGFSKDITVQGESSTAVSVSGFSDPTKVTCTATESQLPGYTADGTPKGSCTATLSVGSCTITNTRNDKQFTVAKVFTDGTTVNVSVTLACTSSSKTVFSKSGITVAGGSSSAVSVTGFEDATKTDCTATEAPVSGYTGSGNPSGSCTAKLSVGSCTITNTPSSKPFTVRKNFSDSNPASVSVGLKCTSGTVANTPLNASESTGYGHPGPAVFTVNGYASSSSTWCTAQEQAIPAGYTGSGSPAGSCTARLSDGGCTITNTRNAVGSIEVTKEVTHGSDRSQKFDFTLSGPGGSQTASLSDGESHTWTNLPTDQKYTLTETYPDGWQLAGVGCDPDSRTTNGNPVSIDLGTHHDGYHSYGDGYGDGYGDEHGDPHVQCTFTNRQTSKTFTVSKVFKDEPDATTTVTGHVWCSSGTVADGGTFTITGNGSATVTVNDVWSSHDHGDDTWCFAKEDPVTGYTGSGWPDGSCYASLDWGRCTITNTRNAKKFTISKKFSDDSTSNVSVNLVCTSSGTPVFSQDGIQVPGGSSTSVTVTGFDDARHTRCTATEDPVPSGYTGDPGTCTESLSTGKCTIVNKLNSATFTVNKVYSGGGTTPVTVSLACSSGDATPSSTTASPGFPAVFTVEGFDSEEPGSCTATESDVPDGYTPDGNGICTAALTKSGSECTITNVLNTAEFTVLKDFEPAAPDGPAGTVPVSVSCTDAGKDVGGGNFEISEGSPAVVTVSGFTSKDDTTCTATETTIPDGYSASGDPEGTCSASLADASCTITNTLNSATFSVSKDFSDDNTEIVTVRLTCTSGTVTPDSSGASEGKPAKFTVDGFSRADGPVSCDATEDPVAGYTGSDGGSCGAPLEGDGGGGCTITNTKNIVPPPTATFTVLKTFSDNNPARVTVRVSCTAPATVIGGATTVAQGSPALIGVSGFDSKDTTTCTAIEVPISGYTGSGNPVGSCAATLAAGSCTITNTLNTAPFTVSKVFSDANPASVTVSVACTSGTVGGGSTSASQGSPATVTVTKFANAATTTCTASETPVAGYTGSGSPTGTCRATLGAGGCTITNTLIPPPPPPQPPPPPGPTPAVVTPVVVPPPPPVRVAGTRTVRGSASSQRRVLVAGEFVRLKGTAPPGCNPVLRVDGRLIGPIHVGRDGSFDVNVGTGDLDPGKHVAVVECTNPTAPLLTKVFWVAAPLSSSNILVVALSSMTMLMALGWVGMQTLAGAGAAGAGAGAGAKPT